MIAIVLIFAAFALSATACESNSHPTSRPDVMPTPGHTSPTPVQSGETDVDSQTYQVDSTAEVLRILDDIGWEDALVFQGGKPNRLLVWEAGGHFHARTDYVGVRGRVSLVQAEGEGLPPGDLVVVRGEDGVKADGNFYWIERDFVVSLSPGRRSLADALTWVST